MYFPDPHKHLAEQIKVILWPADRPGKKIAVGARVRLDCDVNLAIGQSAQNWFCCEARFWAVRRRPDGMAHLAANNEALEVGGKRAPLCDCFFVEDPASNCSVHVVVPSAASVVGLLRLMNDKMYLYTSQYF